MPRYLVEYKHVEETTYRDWVEADSEEEAIEKVSDDPNFEEEHEVQGIECKDFEIVEEEDEEDEDE